MSLRGRDTGGAIRLPRLRRGVLFGLRDSGGIGRVLSPLRGGVAGRDRDVEVRIVRALLIADVENPDDRSRPRNAGRSGEERADSMQTMWSASVWSAAMIGVPGDGDVAPRRGSDANVPPVGGGAPLRDAQVQRPPFVREAQRALQDLGYHPGPIDGMFGPQTRLALQKYQQAEKLPVTGQLDAGTMERLDVYKRLFRPVRER